MLEEGDFEYDRADVYREADSFTKLSIPYASSSLWPFPDPNQGLETFMSANSTNYLVQFEKWWKNIQENKQLIAQSEYSRLVKESERKFGKTFNK